MIPRTRIKCSNHLIVRQDFGAVPNLESEIQNWGGSFKKGKNGVFVPKIHFTYVGVRKKVYLLYKECIVHVRSDRKLWSICTGHYHCHGCCCGRRLAVVNVIVSWLKKPTCLFPSTFVRMLNTLFVSPRLIIPAARERCRRRKIVLSSKITTVNFFWDWNVSLILHCFVHYYEKVTSVSFRYISAAFSFSWTSPK